MTGLTGTLAIFNGFDYGSILWTCGDREESLGDKGMTTKAYKISTLRSVWVKAHRNIGPR
jgi:hypothetical protein